jgi:hypothetical protein
MGNGVRRAVTNPACISVHNLWRPQPRNCTNSGEQLARRGAKQYRRERFQKNPSRRAHTAEHIEAWKVGFTALYSAIVVSRLAWCLHKRLPHPNLIFSQEEQCKAYYALLHSPVRLFNVCAQKTRMTYIFHAFEKSSIVGRKGRNDLWPI